MCNWLWWSWTVSRSKSGTNMFKNLLLWSQIAYRSYIVIQWSHDQSQAVFHGCRWSRHSPVIRLGVRPVVQPHDRLVAWPVTSDCATSGNQLKLVTRLILAGHDWSHDRSYTTVSQSYVLAPPVVPTVVQPEIAMADCRGNRRWSCIRRFSHRSCDPIIVWSSLIIAQLIFTFSQL